MRVHPILDAVYKTLMRFIWEHANKASQTAHLVVTIIYTTKQPLALLTQPTFVSPRKLND